MTQSNPDTVRGFMEAYHEGAKAACAGLPDPGCLQVIRMHPSDGKPSISGRFEIGDIDNSTATALADAEAGFNSYVECRTIPKGTAKRGDLTATRAVFALVVDSDADTGKAGIQIGDPTLRVETSPGNGHDWYFLDKAISAEEAQKLGAELRAASGADSATGKPAGLYRVAGTPNFPNSKKIERGRATCATHFVNGGPTYTAERLRELIGPVAAVAATVAFDAERNGFVSRRVEEILARPTAGRDRSKDFAAAVMAAFEDEMTVGDFEALAREHPQGCASKYLEPTDRLRRETERMWSKHALSGARTRTQVDEMIGPLMESMGFAPSLDGSQATQATSNADYFFDGDRSSEPPPALIKEVLQKNGIAFIGGQSGAGKTFIAIYLTLCLAAGLRFFGRRVKERVGTAYIAAEGAGTLQVRISAARKNFGLEPQPIAIIDLADDLSKDREVEKLINTLVELNKQMLKRFGVRLGHVVIDTLAAAFALDSKGDPNAQAAATIRRARRIQTALGATVTLVHHYGKDPTTGLLGASGWRAGADDILSALADRNEITGKVSNRALALAKSRVGPEGPIAPFELPFVPLGEDEDGDVYGSLYVQPDLAGSFPEQKNTRGSKLSRPLIALKAAFADAGASCSEDQLIMGNGPKMRVVPLTAVRASFVQRYVTAETDPKKASGAVRTAFGRAIHDASKIELQTGSWNDREWVWRVPASQASQASQGSKSHAGDTHQASQPSQDPLKGSCDVTLVTPLDAGTCKAPGQLEELAPDEDSIEFDGECHG